MERTAMLISFTQVMILNNFWLTAAYRNVLQGAPGAGSANSLLQATSKPDRTALSKFVNQFYKMDLVLTSL